MKKWKRILWVLAVPALTIPVVGWYLYTKKPADTRKQAPVARIAAAVLATDFSVDETRADKQYTDKVIAVKGIVSDVVPDARGLATVLLEGADPMSGVTCSFYADESASVKTLDRGEEVTIQGLCTGKLNDVVLIKCSIK